jgi:macrodomain Ter protein organizer (MatP/YcbG family)
MKSQPEEMKSIELDISDDVFLKLAMQAHERHVTLNTHIIDVIKDKLKDAEYQFEKGTKPQLLAEDKT